MLDYGKSRFVNPVLKDPPSVPAAPALGRCTRAPRTGTCWRPQLGLRTPTTGSFPGGVTAWFCSSWGLLRGDVAVVHSSGAFRTRTHTHAHTRHRLIQCCLLGLPRSDIVSNYWSNIGQNKETIGLNRTISKRFSSFT